MLMSMMSWPPNSTNSYFTDWHSHKIYQSMVKLGKYRVIVDNSTHQIPGVHIWVHLLHHVGHHLSITLDGCFMEGCLAQLNKQIEDTSSVRLLN